MDAAGFVTFPLACTAGSAGEARRLTSRTLRGWGLGSLVDDASVIVSELVTNAVRYGRPVSVGHRPMPPATVDQPFLLSLVHCEQAVLCAVFDPGRDAPRLKEPDFLRESGRGLHVLASLAANWGWTTPDRHGKAVWALLSEQPADDNGTGPAQDDPEWDPLTRLLLLLELLSGPSWLKALGTSSSELAS
ncbi:ATP-binding protein [Streptomyces sp. RFCAC02]|uniref:ATP-binding protein n=1 Tax=Streptomyces sp. RFCAC02 TaxID=2499143 RepID=UPI0010206288|nr:ATP-binding protein [Streptomyces sp. RFCAC02]